MNNIEIKWQRNYYDPTIDLTISAHRRDLIPFLRNAATERITGISHPVRIFSDGTYIWVLGRHHIYKIDPQTNEINYSYIGASSRFADDGKRIWVTQYQDIKRIKIINKNTLLTEEIIDTTPFTPWDIVFAGDSMWVSTWRLPYELRVYDLNLNIRHTTEGLNASTLAFDGVYIYAFDFNSGKIRKIHTFSHTIEAEIDVSAGNFVCNRGNLYATSGSKLGHINPETNTFEEDLDVSPDYITALCFDINGYIWLTTQYTNTLFKYAHRPLEYTPRMRLIEQFGIGRRCYDLAFDGTHLWAISYPNNCVYKIPAFDLSFHWSPPY